MRAIDCAVNNSLVEAPPSPVMNERTGQAGRQWGNDRLTESDRLDGNDG